MMVSRFLLLALIALFFTAMSVAAAADDAEFNPEGSLVVNLSEATFDEQLSKTEYALVEFYAPWCPHCKKLVPPYEQLAKEVSEDAQLKDKVTIAKIDCDVNQGVPSKFGVQGFPTIKLLKNGKLFKDYDGPRTAEAFKNFLIKKTGPSTVSLKSLEEAKAFVTEKRAASATTTIVIGQFLSADSENRQKFLAAADEPKLDGFLFAEVVGDSNTEKEQYEVHPYFEDASVDTADFDHIASFVISKGFPKVDELSGETFTRFADAGLPIVIAFTKFSDEDMKKKTIDLMNEVAKDEKLDGKVSLTYSDGDIYGEQYKVMGGNPEQLPGIAIMNLEKRTNFPYTGEWKADEISAFIQGVVSGEIQPNLRSQPVPETQDEPVYVLVGKNFDEIVLNEDRDVFVEFYAPWCGHCKTLAPQYEEVAKAFSSVPQDKLIIAKIDATENDTPNAGVEVQGFPTLYFYPAGKKAPIAYEGDRTAADMIAFVKKHAVAAKELVHDEL